MREWADLEANEPAIAAAGRRLLEGAPIAPGDLETAGVPGVALLATVSASGRPRMHPFIPAIVEGALWRSRSSRRSSTTSSAPAPPAP